MKTMISILYILSLITMTVSANGGEKRIEVSEVNVGNYEHFTAQLKNDLPIGTPIEDVKTFLMENNIRYSHATAESCIKFMIKKIDSSFFVFKTDFQVKIFLSEDAKCLRLDHG